MAAQREREAIFGIGDDKASASLNELSWQEYSTHVFSRVLVHTQPARGLVLPL